MTMQTTRNVLVGGIMSLSGEIILRSIDTMFVSNDDPEAIFRGRGTIRGNGLVQRFIRSNVGENYQFESAYTYARFARGVAPSVVTMRAYAGVNPDSLGSGWVEVPSYADPITDTVIADSVHGFSRWTTEIFSKHSKEAIRPSKGSMTLEQPKANRLLRPFRCGTTRLSLNRSSGGRPSFVSDTSSRTRTERRIWILDSAA